jgi:transposase
MGWRCWSRTCCARIRSQAICFPSGGRKANLIKIVFWDGNGLCLFTKRLDQGGFIWPQADDRGGKVVLSSAQLSLLLEGIDWRAPERVWRPAAAG